MKKISTILFFLILILINFVSVSTANDKTKLCEEIISKQMEIYNFQVEADLEVIFSTEQKSIFQFTYYFSEPDHIYVDTRDFVLLPTETLKSIQPSFFQTKDYKINYLGSSDNEIYELIPNDPQKTYNIILAIDPTDRIINNAQITFQIPSLTEKFIIRAKYEQVAGYAMPVDVEGTLAIPTKFTYDWKIKDFNKGEFTLHLYDYKINQEIPEKIRCKM